MKELNSETLNSALRNLRSYQPRKELWDSISAELSEDDLQKAIDDLPEYFAPEGVWKNIQSGLVPSSPRRLSLRLIAIAASVLILVSAVTFLLIQSPEKNRNPIAEKEATTVPLTSAEIAEYENQMASEEKALQDCLEENRNGHDEEIEIAVQKLAELTATRDSLSLLLKAGKSRPGTSPRLTRLEKRRKQMIVELHRQLCE